MPICARLLLTFLIFLVSPSMLTTACFAEGSPESEYADIALMNGTVYTVEYGTDWPNNPQEAIAIHGRTILAVDTSSGIKQYIGPETRVHDLKGKMVLPGFIDTHIHLGAAAQIMAGVDLLSCTSLYEIQKNISTYAEKNHDDPAIRGFGWNYFLFNESGPNKEMLDQVISDKPIILTSFDGHATWVNSRALEIAGITVSTPDPAGGKIERDSEGNPTGVLREMAASNLVTSKIPPLTIAQIKDMLEKILPRASEAGITTADDAAVSPEIISAFADLEDEGKLPVRIFGEIVALPELGVEEIPFMDEERSIFYQGYPAIEEGHSYIGDLPGLLDVESQSGDTISTIPVYSDNNGLFRIQTGKLFLDGVVEGHTGYLIEPYADDPSTYGTINWDVNKFQEMIAALDSLGFQIDIHAIGDGAVRMCLDAYQNAQEKNGVRDSRHKISHIQLIDPSDIHRIHDLGIIAALQPNWFYYDENFEHVSLPYLGEERAHRMYSLKTILDSGGVVAFGTDYPVGTDYLTYNPLDGIRTSVTRLPLPPDSPITEPYHPDELIDLKTAIEAYTYWGAYTNFMENSTGTLEKGKFADLVILDKDLFSLPPEDINTARVAATYLEGKKVFADAEFSADTA